MEPITTAALIMAAAGVASQLLKGGQKGFAPAPDVGGGQRQPFQIPSDIFGSQQKGQYSFLGHPLSQSLEEGGITPQFGSQTMSPFEMQKLQNQYGMLQKGK